MPVRSHWEKQHEIDRAMKLTLELLTEAKFFLNAF